MIDRQQFIRCIKKCFEKMERTLIETRKKSKNILLLLATLSPSECCFTDLKEKKLTREDLEIGTTETYNAPMEQLIIKIVKSATLIYLLKIVSTSMSMSFF